MRVLILTSTFEPLTGGAETYARLLAEGLVRRGHEVVVATDGSWLDDVPKHRVESGVRVIRLRDFAERVDARDKVKWRQMQYSVLTELSAELRGERFDVVHANSHESLVLAAVVALDQEAALAASLHEQNPDKEAFGAGRCRLSYQTLPVGVYFAASRFYAERAVRFGVSPDRLRLVYHGVETFEPPAGARETFRKRLGIEDGKPLLVCPGRVYTRKNQHDLMRALPAVLDRVPQARLLLAGRVSDFAYAREMWRLAQDSGVSDAVTLLEDLTAADMPSVYAAADAVVAPSLEEGLGLAVIESMAAGLAVVATDVVGFNEVVTGGHDGLLVPLGDVQALARAVADVLESADLRAELGGRACATVRTRFSQDAMVSATLDGYADALAAQAGRG